MQIKTILNKYHKFKSFVYQHVRFVTLSNGSDAIKVQIVPRRNAKPICSGCGRPGTTYEHLKHRRFDFIPIWGFVVYFLYTMRRVNCRRCGVKVEQEPWAKGKRELTLTYMLYLARWAETLSWKEVAT